MQSKESMSEIAVTAKRGMLVGGHIVAFWPLLITTGTEMVHIAFVYL